MPTSPDGTIVVDGVWKRFPADRKEPLLGAHLSALKPSARRPAGAKWRWVLRDIGLRVEPGESVGIVGTNGAGKTTLLRLLTQVMYPYAGHVDVTGRIGALIDIRAGLHPELSGAENIYFFGALLGLRRREVAARFDDIVAFAELSAALDRPVKYYSSGMQMRLGFAAASFLDPSVLLVDEVLAVGDTAFQQRCLARLRDRLTAGVTLVLVSHDLPAIEATCRRVVWLDEGTIRADGPAETVLDAYRGSVTPGDGEGDGLLNGSGSAENGAVAVGATVRPDGGSGPALTNGATVIEVTVHQREAGWGLVCLGAGKDALAPVFVVRHDAYLEAGTTTLTCRLEHLPLPGGHFQLLAGVFDRQGRPLRAWQPVRSFDVVGPALDEVPPAVLRQTPVYVDVSWNRVPAADRR